MATQVFFQDFFEQLGKGVHHLHAAGDTLRVYLTNDTPSVSADAVKADLAGITVQNGYTEADIQNDLTESGGVATLTCVDVEFTATTGGFGPWRYAVLFNDTATNKNLISYLDYGTSQSTPAGEKVTIDFGASVITLQASA